MSCADVTGYWGSSSTTGTKNLQSFWGLTNDGPVGQQTFDAASRWTQWVTNVGNQVTFKAYNDSGGRVFNQVKPGQTFSGYWHFKSVWLNPSTDINTNLGTPTFTTSC